MTALTREHQLLGTFVTLGSTVGTAMIAGLAGRRAGRDSGRGCGGLLPGGLAYALHGATLAARSQAV